MGKLLYILIFLILITFISCSPEKVSKEIEIEMKLINQLISPVDWIGKIHFVDNHFYTVDLINNEICKFDSTGSIVNLTGGMGRGPGEYLSIRAFEYFENHFFIIDSDNVRLSVLNKDLEFVDSVILRNRYDRNVIKKDSILITIGRHIEDMNDWKINFNIADFYQFEDEKWSFIKNDIFINEFPANINTTNLPVFINFASCLVDKHIYILSSLNPKVIKYDIETGKLETKSYHFPGYLSLEDVDINKYYHKYNTAYFKHINDFCTSPTFLEYHKHAAVFVAQFINPFQISHESEFEPKYEIVLFDKEMNYLASKKTDESIIGTIFSETESIIITTEYFYSFLGEEEPEIWYIHFWELDINGIVK